MSIKPVKNAFVSWSGGKDSCLALYKAISLGFDVKVLFTMFSMENGTSSAHRVGDDVLKAQAAAVGIRHQFGRAAFNEYEQVFVSNLKAFKQQGIDIGIFGDIDLQAHKDWEDNVCAQASMVSFLPLWLMDRRDVLMAFLNAGFMARIVVVDTTRMDTRFLGRDLTLDLMVDLEKEGVDVCGEAGEYHTVVYGGPIFEKPLDLFWGDKILPIEEKWAKITVDTVGRQA